MLKLNRINLKLHEFENKYIKSTNKSKGTSSTSDDLTSDFELSPKLNLNGVTNRLSRENSGLEEEPAETHLRDDRENLGKLTNGHVKEPIVNDEPKIFTRSNLKVKTTNRSKVFNVMENIKLISLDNSAETENEDIKKSTVESTSEAKNSLQNDKAKTALGAKFSSFDNFKASSRKLSAESASETMAKFSSFDNFKVSSRKLSEESASETKTSSSDDNKANGDIIEDLVSPVSDILEDIATVQTDESLPSVPSDAKSAPKNISSEASSVSEVMNYDYSSEFEKLSDASRAKKQNEPQTSNRNAVFKAQADDKDATLVNSSELDQTQSFARASESNGEESRQSNQVKSYVKSLENTSPSRSELFSPIQSNSFDDRFRKKGATAFHHSRENRDDSENMRAKKCQRSESSKRKVRSHSFSEERNSSGNEIITSSDVAQDRKDHEDKGSLDTNISGNVSLKNSQKTEKNKCTGRSHRNSEKSNSSVEEITSSSVDTDRNVREEDKRTSSSASENMALKKSQRTEKSKRRDRSRTNSDKNKSNNNEITSNDAGTDREVREKKDRAKISENIDKVQVLSHKAARGFRENSDESKASVNEITSSDEVTDRKVRDTNARVKSSKRIDKVQVLIHKTVRGFRKNSDEREAGDNEITSPGVAIDRKIRNKNDRVKSKERTRNEISRGDAKLKHSETLISSKNSEKNLRKSKGVLKTPDSNSGKWNNCDSQSKKCVIGSITSRKLVDTVTIAKIKGSAHRLKERGNKDTGETEFRKTDSIRTIKNDISSELGTNKENGPMENVDLTSAKLSENVCVSPKKIPKNTQSVNTQTSPKVCFEENFKAGPEKQYFESNFRTSPKNFCNCCPSHDRKPMDFIAFKSTDGNFETTMNHLLIRQLRFIQNMMEKQNQSHKLNRQIIQQMNSSKR